MATAALFPAHLQALRSPCWSIRSVRVEARSELKKLGQSSCLDLVTIFLADVPGLVFNRRVGKMYSSVSGLKNIVSKYGFNVSKIGTNRANFPMSRVFGEWIKIVLASQSTSDQVSSSSSDGIHRQGRHRRIHAKRDRLLDETECSISCHHVLPKSCVTLFEMHRIEK